MYVYMPTSTWTYFNKVYYKLTIVYKEACILFILRYKYNLMFYVVNSTYYSLCK